MWWITAALIFAGILFMLVELLLVPGVGIGGILSLASLCAACWYTFVYIGSGSGWTVLVLVLILLVVSICMALRAKTWKRFELKTEVTSKVNDESSSLHPHDRGTAQTRLAPMGTGRFGDVVCEVKSSDNSMIAAGTPLEIVTIEDNQVIVKPLTQQ
ncbi:MAG TPA: serine protease [Rikenellaceae bacterium]|nr:serine protease [Rikenellaceae bacterium]